MNVLTQEQLRDHIIARMAENGQAKLSSAVGVSASVLSLIVTGKRGVSEDVAAKFGFTRKTVFVPGVTT